MLCIHIEIACKVQGVGSWGIHQFITSVLITASLSGSLFSPFPPSERTILSTVPCSVQYRDGGWGMEGCVDVWGGVRYRSEDVGGVRCSSGGRGGVE